ncbi:hypothetical protein PM10SUCC1_13540 [Propionigenium maris DSM 9537]|uniref:EAL domain-containing protein n=1 Tax=Propionigenium maris DSM 9537 TaxID=1123000 RepID=A0A9W6GKI3_9FUSO|nr:GGDEF domain-containing phosphodiesterase [Propionigenium maris]GLI55840.1 hypothetical protein PM10SUCC1_13540 [Propionigenium maris DSM 9537]
MKFRDKIWIIFFILVGGVIASVMICEYFYVEKIYTNKESVRMDNVFHYYEEKLEGEFFLKEELLLDKYLIDGVPQVAELRKQDLFIYVSGRKGAWRKEELAELQLVRGSQGYIISPEGNILGYKMDREGKAFIFRLEKENFLGDSKWAYYKIYMEGIKDSRKKNERIKVEGETAEKKYYIPVENGQIYLKLKRDGLLFHSVHKKGQEIYLKGVFVILLLSLLGTRYFERTMSKPIDKAVRRINSFNIEESPGESISLGNFRELKGVEDGINRILEEVQRRRRKYELLYEEIPNFTAILDIDLNIIETNSYFDTHLKKPEASGTESFLNYIPDDKINLFTSLYRKLEEGRSVINEKFYILDDGFNPRDVLLTMRKVKLDGEEDVFLMSAMDMVYFDLLEMERGVKKEKYDKYTKVYTREYGSNYLERYISLFKTSNFRFITALVWLDNFSEAGSGYRGSSQVGLLRILADKIKECLRGTDLICKYERNNFMLLMPMVKARGADIIFERIREKLEERDSELAERLRYVFLEYSGIRSKDDFVQELVEEMKGRRYENREIVEDKIIKALQNEEIKVYFEPLLDLESKRVSLEALLRWKNTSTGTIYPDEFLPLAEESGLLPEITRYVLEEVHRAMDMVKVPISVNISATEFMSGEFLGAIKKIFRDRGKLKKLELEIPEVVLLEDIPKGWQRVRELTDMGVSFNLDHFGSGGSSLLRIKDFNFKRIKTDKTFIEGMEHSEEKINTLRAMIGIGRGLGTPISVVGVEGRVQVRKLLELGCTSFQGEFIGKTSSIEEIVKKLDEGEYERILEEIMEIKG